MRENVHARGEQHDHVQPAAADPAQQRRKATSEESAGGSEHGQPNEGPGESLPPENPSVPRDNNSIESPADAGKTRRTLESDRPSSPSNGQDQPQATFGIHHVLTEQLEELRAHPDRDPVRKAQAIAQLAAGVRVLAEQTAQIEKQPMYPGRDMPNVGVIDQLIADVHRVLAEQIAMLRAHADLDQIKKSRAITRLASEELRLRALHSRRVAEAIHSFDFAAMLEEALKEAQPRIEELQRRARSQEARAENSADERDGHSENLSSGGTASTGHSDSSRPAPAK